MTAKSMNNNVINLNHYKLKKELSSYSKLYKGTHFEPLAEAMIEMIKWQRDIKDTQAKGGKQ